MANITVTSDPSCTGGLIVIARSTLSTGEVLEKSLFITTGTKVPSPTKIFGCMDPNALNYNRFATDSDGSCQYKTEIQQIFGCTDPNALNYNRDATVNNGTCMYPGVLSGCTDPSAINYDSTAVIDDGTCKYGRRIATVFGCMDPNASNYNRLATQDDGSCSYVRAVVLGCTDPNAWNYNRLATQDDGTCWYGQSNTITGGKIPSIGGTNDEGTNGIFIDTVYPT